jgi:flagellar capping protein FliD
MDEQLDSQETRLYTQFYRMELAIGKMQNNLSALDAFTPLDPYTGVST